MRIALIHPRLQRVGGLETRLLNYINYFSNAGHEVHIIVSKVDHQVKVPSSVAFHLVDLKRVPKPVRMWFFNSGVKRIIKSKQFDLSLSLGRTSHQDIVLCPGTHLGFMKALNFQLPGPIDRMNVYLDKLAYRDSKLILAASEKIKDELIELANVPPGKIRILYPPSDTTVFNRSGQADKQMLRERHGFSSTKKSLLFLSTGNRLKGYAFLLQLMPLLAKTNVELIIAGVKPIKTSLPNVTFLGYSSNVNELMWAADALIHPALYEAFAQVVSEALLCGLPVIISDQVGAKSIVTEKEGRVVSGFEFDDWKRAIDDVLAQEWSISPDFAYNNGLTVEQHCKRILEFAAEIQ